MFDFLKRLIFLLVYWYFFMNFNCIFPNCTFKRNNVEEEIFLNHLEEFHHEEIAKISKKEHMPIKTAKMIVVSNSTVFINSG